MADFARLPLDRVAAGPLPAALYEPGRDGRAARLLLAKGEEVTDGLLARLRRRGVRDFVVDRRHLDDVSAPGCAAPAAAPREPVPAGSLAVPADALVRTLTRPAGPPTPARIAAAAARRDAVAAGAGALFSDLDRAGGPGRRAAGVDGAGLRDLSVQTVAALCEDFDLFTRLGLDRPTAERKPWEPSAAGLDRLREHATRTAHLAVAVGCVLGLRRDELEHLALGCLVHDAGMTRLNRALWDGPRRLSAAAFLAVTKHPGHTLDLLARAPEVPPAARAVAYQLHERADGSGYPRGRRGSQVHRLAGVAAVADAYCGMTADRPHRPALAPHAAVRRVAAAGVRGAFDARAVRAFVETVSVFPPGSTVRLADGRCGRVVEARPDRPAEPRVELWDPLAGRFTGTVLTVGGELPTVGGNGPGENPDPLAPAARVVAAGEPLPLAFTRAA